MESIRVAVRIRPEDTSDSCIKLKENVVTISRTKENSLQDTHEFNFDQVFLRSYSLTESLTTILSLI